jgi:RNA polymerase sigma factor (sigma-70 family)
VTELQISALTGRDFQVAGGDARSDACADPLAMEAALVSRAKRDPQAFAALYRQHYVAIAGYVLRRVGDQHLAEDLTADVFLAAVRSLSGYRHRGVPFRAWLYRIATHTVNRWARRNRFYQTLPQSLTYEESNADDSKAARLAMLSLSPKHQAILALHYLEGLSVEEVASVIGCRIGTVKSRLSRARVALRTQLEKGR